MREHDAGPAESRGEHGQAVLAPSVKDVAARAGVSLGTVSNVLNRPAQVSEQTRRRVLAAIEELGFVRNEAGRRLRGASSPTLAYVVLDAANPFFTDVARGVQDAADRAGLMLYLCDSGQLEARQTAYLHLLEQQRVSGVLITPIDPDDPRIGALAERGTPLVIVDGVAGRELCSVSVDNVLGGGSPPRTCSRPGTVGSRSSAGHASCGRSATASPAPSRPSAPPAPKSCSSWKPRR